MFHLGSDYQRESLKRDLKDLEKIQRQAFSKGVCATHLLVYPGRIKKGETDVAFFTRVAGESGYHMMLDFGSKPLTFQEVQQGAKASPLARLIYLGNSCMRGVSIKQGDYFQVQEGEIFIVNGVYRESLEKAVRFEEEVMSQFA